MSAPNIVNVATITAKTDTLLLTGTSAVQLLENPASSGKVMKVNSLVVANVDGTNVSATAAELNHVAGVTSAIQTQLNATASTGKAIAMAMLFG